jgi:hypothetical protein
MSDKSYIENPVNEIPAELHDFLWTAEEIGRVIGRSPRQTHHLLKNGAIKSARRVGRRWCVSRSALLAEFNFGA